MKTYNDHPLNNCEATCLITGYKSDLRMHAIRNAKGEMIGWVFVNKDIIIEDITANWNYKFRINGYPQPK